MNHNEIQVAIKRLPNCVQLPAYQSEGAAAADAYAAIDEPIVVSPGETRLIPLGFAVGVPEGYMLAVLPRSGLASRGIQVANSPGTVDPDYRGSVGVLVYNSRYRTQDRCTECSASVEACEFCEYATTSTVKAHKEDEFVVQPGDRICQVAIVPVLRINWNEVEELQETKRGSGGFGSTGVGGSTTCQTPQE